MANASHVAALREGVSAWNRRNKSALQPIDLVGADLSNAALLKADLSGVDLSEANLKDAVLNGADLTDADLHNANLAGAIIRNASFRWADLTSVNLERATLIDTDLSHATLDDTNLRYANLSAADLREAGLVEADCRGANLSGSNISGADLRGVDFSRANLSEAILRNSNLEGAILTATNLTGATLIECRVYGLSIWDANTSYSTQANLIITPSDQSEITVDNLDVAQFIYLLLANENIRHVINTITSKLVLILGRFTPDRKSVLDALRQELRRRDYLPVLFDFNKPETRNITETVSTLAHMARFVIADITNAKSIPQELQRIVPNLPSVPVQPVLLSSDREYSMFPDFRYYPWVLDTVLYDSDAQLLEFLQSKIIEPAESMAIRLQTPIRSDGARYRL
jgi:uncharacterized protein YjbI with pentapeptide repeats